MERVSKLVGFGADQAGLSFVDSLVEHLSIHIAQLLREQLPDFGEHRLDKGAAAAHEILIESALALMDAHAGAAGEAGVVVAVLHAQLVEGMAALVDGGEHGEGGVKLVVMGGDAHIAGVEAHGEGVLGLGDGAAVGVQADGVHQVLGQLLLLLDGVGLVQEGGVGLLLLGDGLDQGHDDLAQLGEEAVQGLHGQTLLVLVQQGIVGQFLCIIKYTL